MKRNGVKKVLLVTMFVTVIAGIVVGGIVTHHGPSLRDYAEMTKEVAEFGLWMAMPSIHEGTMIRADCINTWPSPGISRCQCYPDPPICG